MSHPLLAALVAWAGLAAGCAAMPQDPACREQIVDRLYLGMSMPGGEVAQADFDSFVATDVASRFPDGFTIFDARGNWRSAAGRVERESTRVLEVVNGGTAGEDARLTEIAESYRARFRQESVLRVSAPGRACFARGAP
jgi:hypothetical protein